MSNNPQKSGKHSEHGDEITLVVVSGAQTEKIQLQPNSPILIGSGPTCQVRHEKLPALHSILTLSPNEQVKIRAVVPVPALLQSDQICEQVQFHNDEMVQIGTVLELQVVRPVRKEQASLSQETATQKTNKPTKILQFETPSPVTKPLVSNLPATNQSKREQMMNKPLKDLSASELAELIEIEERQVAEFDAQQQKGLKNLLQAVQKTAQAEKTESPATIPLTQFKFDSLKAEPQTAGKPVIEQELHHLIEELSELVEVLCGQVQTFANEEPSASSGPETTFKKLLREQHEILEKLDNISEIIAGENGQDPVIRKIA